VADPISLTPFPGTKAKSYSNAVMRTYENVRIVTNGAGDFVRTVIKLGH